jgi:hypothetical protein
MPAPDFLPRYLNRAHELCLLHHDVLVEILRSGQAHGAFEERFQFRSEADRKAFDEAGDVFAWLEQTRTLVERGRFIRRTVFPALLSDFLHFVYEALAASRKAKLTVTYALLRKPLQVSLGVLETLAVSPEEFVRTLSEDPLGLRPAKAGGVDHHIKRVAKVLSLLNEEDRFDPEFLAQLRYDKSCEDSFDGTCNKAMHLFTQHEAIRTERLNINFVFTNDDGRQTQWYFIYSRLPYILYYARLLIEHLFAEFSRTDPTYLADMERRLGAATVLWGPAIEKLYQHSAIDKFVHATAVRIVEECVTKGTRTPTPQDLVRMRESGALPGESRAITAIRHIRYKGLSAAASAVSRGGQITLRVRRILHQLHTSLRDNAGK